MNYKLLLLTMGTTLTMTSVFSVEEGARLFDAKCASCHTTKHPKEMTTLEMSTMAAPPAMGIMNHVKMVHGNKEEAIKFITEYALNPEKNKALCMPKKIKRFGLMPSQKGKVTRAELTTLAAWLYDNFPPKDFIGHGKSHRLSVLKSK